MMSNRAFLNWLSVLAFGCLISSCDEKNGGPTSDVAVDAEASNSADPLSSQGSPEVDEVLEEKVPEEQKEDTPPDEALPAPSQNTELIQLRNPIGTLRSYIKSFRKFQAESFVIDGDRSIVIRNPKVLFEGKVYPIGVSSSVELTQPNPPVFHELHSKDQLLAVCRLFGYRNLDSDSRRVILPPSETPLAYLSSGSERTYVKSVVSNEKIYSSWLGYLVEEVQCSLPDRDSPGVADFLDEEGGLVDEFEVVLSDLSRERLSSTELEPLIIEALRKKNHFSNLYFNGDGTISFIDPQYSGERDSPFYAVYTGNFFGSVSFDGLLKVEEQLCSSLGFEKASIVSTVKADGEVHAAISPFSDTVQFLDLAVSHGEYRDVYKRVYRAVCY